MPRRVLRTRRTGGGMPPGALYAGRGSIAGNPWRVERRGERGPWLVRLSMADAAHYLTRRYDQLGEGFTRVYIYPDPVSAHRRACDLWDAAWDAGILEVQRPGVIDRYRGHDLACWCGLDMPCHVDRLLARLADG